MTLHYQAICNEMQYSLPYMPIGMLQVSDCLVGEDVWFMALNYLTTTFQDSLPNDDFTVWELFNQVCDQLSIIFLEVDQIKHEEFIYNNTNG